MYPEICSKIASNVNNMYLCGDQTSADGYNKDSNSLACPKFKLVNTWSMFKQIILFQRLI